MKHQKLRQIFNKPLGEMITALFHERDLQDMFERNNGVPEELAGLSSGDIALRMGLIDSDTKIALLVAQAGERILQALEKPVRGDYNDDIFKFIGSARDPDILKQSQSVWQLAHIRALVMQSRAGTDDPVIALDKSYVAGFRMEAAQAYCKAGEIFNVKGHDRIAQQMLQLADHIANETQNPARSPKIFAADLLGERNIDPARHVIAANPGPQEQGSNYHDTLIKLYHLAPAPSENTPLSKYGQKPKAPKH